MTDPFIGRLIDGRYLVRSRIARGGMATVYVAQDKRLDRDVAVKVMHPHLAEGSDVTARFRREARAAARLTHPGVVGVYDQGYDGDISYLTMEYVNGHNLRQELRRKGALSVGEALTTVAHILDAIGSAHQVGLVHRDIKPENVLLSHDGSLKVADFGLARAVTEATAASTGNLLGTVAYLSPEIITSATADARADVYATGILLFELLTGRPPYEGDTPIQIAYQHVNEDLPSIRELEPWVPPSVEGLIARFCARNPEGRPEDGSVAKDEVLALLDSLSPEQLAAHSSISKDHKTLKGEETVALTSPSTTALPIGAVSSPTQSLPSNHAPKPKRRRRWVLLTIFLLLVAGAGAGTWWYFADGPGAYTIVPEVAGLDEQEGIALLAEGRLHTHTSREYSDDVDEGVIIRTDPEYLSEVRYESDVEVVVSDGILMVDIPDFDGLEEQEIREALAEAKWDGESLIFTEEWSQKVEKGKFISSSPEVGDTIAHGDKISVVLSGGPRPVTIRSVIGDNEDSAIKALEEQNLKVEVENDEVFSDSVPQGNVVSQSPEEGTDGHEGDVVTLTISKGPELFEVPSVTFKTYDDAKKILEDAGFTVERQDWFGGALGTVRFQDPESGSQEKRGTLITLTVI